MQRLAPTECYGIPKTNIAIWLASHSSKDLLQKKPKEKHHESFYHGNRRTLPHIKQVKKFGMYALNVYGALCMSEMKHPCSDMFFSRFSLLFTDTPFIYFSIQLQAMKSHTLNQEQRERRFTQKEVKDPELEGAHSQLKIGDWVLYLPSMSPSIRWIEARESNYSATTRLR